MSTISQDKLDHVIILYKEGLSVREIADKLKVSIDSAYYFFRKNNIQRRNRAEAKNNSYERKKASFNLKNNLSISDKQLRIAGVMLYWGEGSKWQGEKIVDFANSDTDMIKVFLRFLREVCVVNEEKLRVYLYCYANQNQESLISYWSEVTKISKKQFSKPYVRKDYDSNKKGKMKYGLVHIRYADKKLLNLIRTWIKENIEKFS